MDRINIWKFLHFSNDEQSIYRYTDAHDQNLTSNSRPKRFNLVLSIKVKGFFLCSIKYSLERDKPYCVEN